MTAEETYMRLLKKQEDYRILKELSFPEMGKGGVMMKVFIAFTYRGWEGCSEPLAVFDSKEKADIYLAGYKQSYSSDLMIKEMTLNSLEESKP